MRFLQILNWVLLAATGVITLVLAVVCLLFWVYQGEPLIQASFEHLQRDTVIFTGLTALAAAAALSLRRVGISRWLLQGALWVGIAATVWYYLPATS